MKKSITRPLPLAQGLSVQVFAEVQESFEKFCLAAGIETLTELLAEDATALCGCPHARDEKRQGHRWGTTQGQIGFHGGKVSVERPRVRGLNGKELPLPHWEQAVSEDWLKEWAMNLMLINVSTRRYGRAVRLPTGDIPAEPGSGLSKSAASRRFVALSSARLQEWMASDLSLLDLVAIQIDGLHLADELMMVAAVGIDMDGIKHPLGLMEGATENAAVVQALLNNLVDRGLDPAICRLFIVDGAKALSKAIRRIFGRNTPIQRCQVHKARNIVERLPKHLHASVRKALKQAWERDDADKAEKLIRNLASRLEHEAPGVSASILEGIDEILTVVRLKVPAELRRSLACTNIIENVNSTIRRVCKNVRRWRDAKMALRWTGAAMLEAAKGFRRLKGYRHMPALKTALLAHQASFENTSLLVSLEQAA